MPAPFVGAIEQLFRVSPEDAARLGEELFKRSKLAYERVVNEQLATLGREPNFRLLNSGELLRLRLQASDTAFGIAQTYNEDLARKVDQVLEAEGARGLNRRTLARRLSDWDAERQVWKAESIARTEGARIAQQAVTAFVESSRLEQDVRYIILPKASDHDDLNDQLAREGQPIDHETMVSLGLPQHPNERHSVNVAFPVDVSEAGLWLGG